MIFIGAISQNLSPILKFVGVFFVIHNVAPKFVLIHFFILKFLNLILEVEKLLLKDLPCVIILSCLDFQRNLIYLSLYLLKLQHSLFILTLLVLDSALKLNYALVVNEGTIQISKGKSLLMWSSTTIRNWGGGIVLKIFDDLLFESSLFGWRIDSIVSLGIKSDIRWV